MTACRDQDELLTLHAAGALEPAEETRLRAHLESCAACRDELEAQREVFGLAALPPPSVREQAVLAVLPRTTLGTWRRTQVQQAARMRTAGALLAVAAVVLLVLGPVVSRRMDPRGATQVEPLASPSDPAEDTTSALEQWALADPLADELELAEPDSALTEDGTEVPDSELEEYLTNPNPGDAL
ncbi:MAG TPA: zf-HC2 domain-containing protein [Archangium sp.]|jgi:anti-sigma factor RsiW|uniref:anti-sigma factor family protein n=1 Tax=Archangium sp. TaxID=1872627 RepID=UPI002ED800C7